MTGKPRFLHVSSYAPPHGGASHVMAEQVEAQRQFFDDDVTVVSFEPGFAPLQEKGVRVVRLRGRAVRQDWFPRLSEYGTLWRLVGEADCIVLHSPYYVINCVAALMAALRRKRAVCIHHGHLPSEFRNRLNISLMNRLVAAWLILDPAHRDYLATYTRNLRPARLITNGIWLDRLRSHARKKSGSICHFIYCGRLAWDKGTIELAAAAAAFPDCRFTLVGDGEERQRFEGMANVTLAGFVPHEQALALIAQADCLILPSYHETFPLVVAEALAMGVPVIVSDLNESIRNLVHGNGLLIQPESSDSLNAAITQALAQGLVVGDREKILTLDWSRVIPEVRQAFLTI